MTKVLRVGIDAGPLAYPYRTGIGRSLECILPHLIEAAGDNARFTLFTGKPLVNPVALALLERKLILSRTCNTPSLYAWQQTGMLAQRLFSPQDVFFAPDGLFPPFLPGPTVGMYHDALWRVHPETLPFHVRTVFRLRHKAGLKRADRAITGAHAAKAEMLRLFGPLAEKLEVLPCHGVDTALFHPPRPDEGPLVQEFRLKYNLTEPFLLTAGNLLPHKNLPIVPKALTLLLHQGRDIPTLAVAGFGDQDALLAMLPPDFPREKIRCLGYLPEPDLCQAYRLAQAYIFPSLYEGFGLPVLEAQASGAPVIAANAASLPEVAGNTALLFEPRSPDDLAAKIAALQDDPGLRDRMIAGGFAQSAKYRWDRAGQALWRVLREAARGLRPLDPRQGDDMRLPPNDFKELMHIEERPNAAQIMCDCNRIL